MNRRSIRQDEPEERDLIDAIPGLDRASSSLQRAVGPSCLLSLIITALVLILIRRYVKLPITGMVVLTFLIWWGVLTILVRYGRPMTDDEE